MSTTKFIGRFSRIYHSSETFIGIKNGMTISVTAHFCSWASGDRGGTKLDGTGPTGIATLTEIAGKTGYVIHRVSS